MTIGKNSGYNGTTGANNVYIGREAGLNNVTGSGNLFVGAKAGPATGASSLSNAAAIGNNATVSVSNALVLGNNINVGIGTSSPAARLEVSSGTPGISGLRLTNLNTTTSAGTIATASRFLTVDAQGYVVLGNATGARVGADESAVWKSNGDNIANTNSGAVIVGSGITSTPAGYKLFVSEGILTEKVKVAVRNTSDWSDNVFESTYNRPTLEQVKRFIDKNHHLPGIPSAEQVVKEGVDVGKMDAMLLAKIEELTLYMLELKAENNRLKVQGSRLEKLVKQQRRNRK